MIVWCWLMISVCEIIECIILSLNEDDTDGSFSWRVPQAFISYDDLWMAFSSHKPNLNVNVQFVDTKLCRSHLSSNCKSRLFVHNWESFYGVWIWSVYGILRRLSCKNFTLDEWCNVSGLHVWEFPCGVICFYKVILGRLNGHCNSLLSRMNRKKVISDFTIKITDWITE